MKDIVLLCQVHQLYMTVNTEAGKPLEVSDLATVKVGKKALKCERQPESAFLVHWGQLLKLPDSVRDPKVMFIRTPPEVQLVAGCITCHALYYLKCELFI